MFGLVTKYVKEKNLREESAQKNLAENKRVLSELANLESKFGEQPQMRPQLSDEAATKRYLDRLRREGSGT